MKLVKPKKFLGQHFLKDLKVAQDIADTVDMFPALPILEVGPGMGVLTQFLVKKGRPVKVVEVDYESVAYLREAYPSLEDCIIEDDFLKMNLHRVFNGEPFVLTGNYPYNISSQIFFKMLENKELIPCCTGMIQIVLQGNHITRGNIFAPTEFSQRGLYCIFNTSAGKRAKSGASFRLVRTQGGQQTDHALLDQIVLLQRRVNVLHGNHLHSVAHGVDQCIYSFSAAALSGGNQRFNICFFCC